MDLTRNQLYIEGENNDLFIYFHLPDFKTIHAKNVMDKYIEAFKDRDFEKLNISFINHGVPGEHLSRFRKTSDKAIGRLLKGIKHIEACFHFKENQTIIGKPKFLNLPETN